MSLQWSSLAPLVPLHAKPDDDITPLVGSAYFTQWDFPPWVVISLSLWTGCYLYGVWVLSRRGDRWSKWRTASFLWGQFLLAIANFSFLGVYDTVLFWPHMVQHMLLNMVAPVFLVAAAPGTLAVRVLRGRPRELLLTVMHSWLAKVVLFPPLTFGLTVASPFLLYLTGWYNLTLRNELQHDLLHIYMVVLGCLFFMPLLGPDPQPFKIPYPIRIVLFILTMPFHAFLGVMIMGSKHLIAEDWYLSFERSWGLSPLTDQSWAGGLMWATGDLTMASAMGVIFARWILESQREARRLDRKLDREEARQAKGRQKQLESEPTAITEDGS